VVTPVEDTSQEDGVHGVADRGLAHVCSSVTAA